MNALSLEDARKVALAPRPATGSAEYQRWRYARLLLGLSTKRRGYGTKTKDMRAYQREYQRKYRRRMKKEKKDL